jgi:hypothetical protein
MCALLPATDSQASPVSSPAHACLYRYQVCPTICYLQALSGINRIDVAAPEGNCLKLWTSHHPKRLLKKSPANPPPTLPALDRE